MGIFPLLSDDRKARALRLLAGMQQRDLGRPRTLPEWHAKEFADFAAMYGPESPTVLRLGIVQAAEFNFAAAYGE